MTIFWAGLNFAIGYAYYLVGLSFLGGGVLLWHTRGRSLVGVILVLSALLSSSFVAIDVFMHQISTKPFTSALYMTLYGLGSGVFCFQTKQTTMWHCMQVVIGAILAITLLLALGLLENCKRGNCL